MVFGTGLLLDIGVTWFLVTQLFTFKIGMFDLVMGLFVWKTCHMIFGFELV
jgi:hypothetical protein